jgi:hypothetical protein
MSVQLILYPQYYDGSSPLSSTSTEFFVDGVNFNTVNASSSTLNISGSLPQAFINSYTIFGYSFFTINSWYRFSSNSSAVFGTTTNEMSAVGGTGILQRLSNLTFGATYDLTFNIQFNTTTFTVYQYHHNVLKSTHTITGAGTQTIQFDAYSTADIIVIHSVTSALKINDISCVVSTSTPSGVFTDLSNGQVICDLYEDEDIPLTLSVDDFKNVAEKVQSYSKAFNLPATKRNNQIFDNIFEVTRTDTGLNFNPYKKTQCVLKQDGFTLFEGYLRLIDIQDKEGEISYNVNLYSEVVALADVLKDRTFSDLDFTELEHDYNYTQIKYSWNDTGSSITYSNSGTSGFRDDYTTLRYPFIDWEHQVAVGGSNAANATAGNPELLRLENAFRPTINIKYLIDRIFAASPFTYTSDFFDTAGFGKLYMDFNWGSADAPVTFNNSASADITSQINCTAGTNTIDFTFSSISSNFGYSSGVFTAQAANQIYDINYDFNIYSASGGPYTVVCEWVDSLGNTYNSQTITPPLVGAGSTPYVGSFISVPLSSGDTLKCVFTLTTGIVIIGAPQTNCCTATTTAQNTTNNTLLETLRGELGQWDFLKGLLTMFNLVTLPDEDNPSNIKIEPYNDVFLENDDSTPLDWTDKIDVTEMKLTPLTELNKKTIFKFVEDDDDWAFNNYKNSVGGHLYGSHEQDEVFYTILDGEKEIVAEPFAATVPKALMSQFSDFITPAVYSYNPTDQTSEGFDNSPRIMYNNGKKTLTSCAYYIPAQNGVAEEVDEDEFLQFSHLTEIPTSVSIPPTSGDTVDFNFGICQTSGGIGTTPYNLYSMYWAPYYNELYNPDTRTMTIKVNLSPSDINTFKFYDIITIKNREFRVNKIDYKPNDLATVEFILIP